MRAAESLKLLQEVGLGYFEIGAADQHAFGRGEPAVEVGEASGGGSGGEPNIANKNGGGETPRYTGRCFFSTSRRPVCTSMMYGCCSKFFNRLTVRGIPVVVIEHNLDVIKRLTG